MASLLAIVSSTKRRSMLKCKPSLKSNTASIWSPASMRLSLSSETWHTLCALRTSLPRLARQRPRALLAIKQYVDLQLAAGAVDEAPATAAVRRSTARPAWGWHGHRP